MRIRLAAIIAGIALAAGCSEPTSPDGRQAANDAAQTLLHLADSLSQHGGNASEVGAYRGLASLLIGNGRLSTVTISVDGVASEYLATAQQLLIDGCPPGALCTLVAVPPTQSVVAWEKKNPRRMVQLFNDSFLGTIVTVGSDGITTSQASLLPSLLFLDGAGAMYGGNASSRAINVTLSDTPCTQSNVVQPAIHPTWPCRQAEFTVAFDGTVTLIPLDQLLPDSLAGTTSTGNAAPSHRVTMTSQNVHGSHAELTGLCMECPNPPTTPPVSTPWRDSLTATLSATVGTDVTFTFTVKNTSAQGATVQFSDAQQYDIRVWNANDVLVWRWGADKAFAQTTGTRTLAPGESVTYVEHWKPASAGAYHAMAYLTSSSHGAVAFANFSSP